ncbi:PAS domain-containing protein [Prosthecobacter sp.]|uniref:PAS domain-containing protein n=1 Tax=Prosthecobacter sp. TaxID=1965333 RepID=UPI002488FA01|nr:PAS domain-containing protein [Prosthecobacter sp.]MDI1310887.1 PAS domain-containing protein [Prosthecobacter sp.]
MPLPNSADSAALGAGAIATHELQMMEQERLLQEARRRMESVLVATEVGTWEYDIVANRVWADANLARMFGVSEEEAEGGRLGAYLAAVHPEDIGQLEGSIGAALRKGSKFVSEYRLRQQDGTYRSVIARGKVERDERGKPLRMPGVVVDVTERVEAESDRLKLQTELDRQRRTMEAMLSSITDFVYSFDHDGRFIFVNKPLLDLWGLELKDAVGKNFFDLYYPDELAGTLQRQIQQVFDTRLPVTDRTPYTSSAGVVGFYEYIFSPVFSSGGEVESVAGSTRDVTRDQNALTVLQQNEAVFRQLADSMPQIVWSALPDGALDYYNQRWFEFIGAKSGDKEKAEWSLHIHEEDLPKVAVLWTEALAAGTPYAAEFRVRRADGEFRWFLVRALPLRDAEGVISRWYGTCTDIHEQRDLQARLERSEVLFRQLADTMPQLAWMARPDGWIFWYNRRWYEYTGTTQEEMEGWGWQEVNDPETLPSVVSEWQKCIENGQPFDMTFPLRGADGVFRPFLSRAMPHRDATGAIVLWFGSNTDVSEQKRRDEERTELLASERAARTQAEHASRMKDEFLATLSHEIRSPLNAIFGWTQILREEVPDAETLATGLEVIDRNVRMQTQLIEDLLDMSRIISGKLRLDVQQLHPATCIKAAIETVMPAATAKDIRVEQILDPQAGPMTGDPSRMQQIVWNLLSNAIKFTPKGGKVLVTLQRVNSHLELSVCDSGEGISAEFLPHVFDRFRQADAAMNRKHGGLGLGLAIVKQLVELHGGTIRVHSAGAGKGATFTVDLPLQAVSMTSEGVERMHPQSSNAHPHFRKNTDLLGIKVLVVDDEDDARELVRRILRDCEAEVSVAASASEALDLIPTLRPDLILSDIGMPNMDGYEFLRRLRKLDASQGGETVAVALTAFARAEDRIKALQVGFLSHVSKPVEPTELVATISAVARQSRRR